MVDAKAALHFSKYQTIKNDATLFSANQMKDCSKMEPASNAASIRPFLKMAETASIINAKIEKSINRMAYAKYAQVTSSPIL
jgi:hypothetical protein